MTARNHAMRAGLIALASTLLIAAPAGAHPFFRGGEVPIDSLATITLDLAHGCDSEDPGAGEDTTEVALQVPDWMRIVEVAEPEGWDVDLQRSTDGSRVEVVTWLTDDPQEPAPTFDLDVVVEGEVGDERHVGVFQACEDTVYRWVGTPDEPADDPAVRLTLTEPDPDAPPPPQPEPELEAAEEGTEDATEEALPGEEPEEAEEPAIDPEADPEAADPEATEADAGDAPTDGTRDGTPWLVILILLVALTAAGVIVARRARGRVPDEG